MMQKARFVPLMLLFAAFVLLITLLMQPASLIQFRNEISVLFPKGIIGLEERNLLLIIQGIMLLVIIPVYILTFIFSYKYRAENTKATYDPDLVDNRLAEYLWWGIPLVFTLIIAGVTWVKTHELDPYKPIPSDKKPIAIQVIALQWKWLFIYREENIASLNFLQFPKATPIRFEITSDAPMNSFWIPHLGGQIYAMPGMKTELNLISDQSGDFRGSSANLSGEGFAGMHFVARASSDEDFHKWIESGKQSSEILSADTYKQLVAPSQNNPVQIYRLQDSHLFEQTIMKYMHPQ